jgi:hypothetical protein
MRWFRFRRSRPADGGAGRSASDELLNRFGHTCPVCGAGLGRIAPVDATSQRFEVPPSLRLYLGAGDRSGPTWRVSIVDGNYPPATSRTPPYSDREVDFIYLLCGGGHFFPDSEPIFHAGPGAHNGGQRIDVWNMVAALGAPASGKTYLLLRTLHQSLVNERNLEFDDIPDRIRLRELSPLENMPLLLRADGYNKTRSVGEPIPETAIGTWATPADILDYMLPDALRAIQDMIKRTMLDGAQRAQNWGAAIRQPLVLRADTVGRRTWTGVADLPGELFSDLPENLRESMKLRAYDTLIWVIDPAVAGNALDWIDDEPGHDGDEPGQEHPGGSVLDGSLRPGTTRPSGQGVVRTTREQIQRYIGRQLTKTYNRFADDSIELLVAVNKCDLIRAALRKGTLSGLNALGLPGRVRSGVTAYLLFMASRFAQRAAHADASCASILRHIYPAEIVHQTVREERAGHVANGLIRHYSDHDKFWNLVEEGEPESVLIPAAGMNRPLWDIYVPGIGEHLDAFMLDRSARRILMRDLVMSAIGCGVACGLGNEMALVSILKGADQGVRFFLCSPLGTVPVAGRDADLLFPLESGAQFPQVDDRSAALTQLLLAMLGKVRR